MTGYGKKAFAAAAALVIGASLIHAGAASAEEWSGFASAEVRLFFHPPAFPGQERHSASLALQPEFYHEWKGGAGAGGGFASFTAVPFARLDSADPERTHFDMREFFVLRVYKGFEVGVGLRKVFWGVTEGQHLVDIINQTDLVESPDGEEKLGQPMLNVSVPLEWGTFDLFVMPWFRERTFPGKKGRLRSEPRVDTDRVEYESGAEESHVDLALRYSNTFGYWDVGLSHFRGTGREPTLLVNTDNNHGPVLIPFYEQIDQSGLDVQWTVGEWLWKLEAIRRGGQGEGGAFEAWSFGFEYTFVGVAGSRMDLGVLSEWLHDTRGKNSSGPFEDDLLGGVRLMVNDLAGTEALFGVVRDLDTDAFFYFVEAGRRFTDHLKATLEVRGSGGLPEDDRFKSVGRDDFFQFELAYYF